MTPAVVGPTLIIGYGEMGESVVRDLSRDVGTLPDAPVRLISGHTADECIQRISLELEALLTVEFGEVRNRLDVVVIADARRSGSLEAAYRISDELSETLATRFARVLPPRVARDQRQGALTIVLAVSPVTPSPETQVLLNALKYFEQWHRRDAAAWVLSRIYLVTEQNEAGRLRDEDLERSIYLFAAACWFSGLRDHDEVLRRVANPGSDHALISCFIASAADVSVDEVMTYCMWRTAAMALTCLSEHSTRRLCQRAGSVFDVESWHREWSQTISAQELRNWADRQRAHDLPSGLDSVPWHWSSMRAQRAIGTFLAGNELWEEGEQFTEVDQEVERNLDQREVATLEDMQSRLDTLVLQELDPNNALQKLPGLVNTLDQAAGVLHRIDSASVTSKGSKPGATAAKDRDNQRRIQGAIASRPDPVAAAWAAMLLSFIVFVLIAGVWAMIGSVDAPGGVVVSPTASRTAAPLGLILPIAALVGLAVGFAWFAIRVQASQRRIRTALAAIRTQAVANLEVHELLKKRVEEQLAIRRQRLTMEMSLLIAAKQRALRGITTTVESAKTNAEKKVRDFETSGDLVGLRGQAAVGAFKTETVVHRRLLSTEQYTGLWEATRKTRGGRALAETLLNHGWPKEDVLHDLPDFGPQWLEQCRLQHEDALSKSVFDWPGNDVRKDVSERVTHFLRHAPINLELGMRPFNDDGTSGGDGGSEILVVSAPAGRPVIDAARKVIDADRLMQVVYGSADTSRVVAIRTHPGFTARQLENSVEARQ